MTVLLRNSGDQSASVNLGYRLYQFAGNSGAPIGGVQSWRIVPLGAGQTVMESPQVHLPQVRGETTFHLVWFDGTTKLGTTSLRVFPENLLESLATLTEATSIGVVDPEGLLKPALAGLKIQELKEAEDILSSEARLIFVAPMAATNQPAGLIKTLRSKAASGAAVVWWKLPPRSRADWQPQVYVLEEGTGRVVVAAAETVQSLADSPRSHLSIVHLAELAVGKMKLKWPDETEP